MRKAWSILLVLPLLVVLFQNCSRLDFSSSASQDSSSKSGGPGGNGVPYDGKPYIFESGNACSDGSLVSARILLQASQSPVTAVLVREDCQDIAPRLLEPAEFAIDSQNSDRLVYAGNSFVAEAPPAPIAKITSWYNQYSQPLTNASAAVFVIDLFNYDAAAIQQLKAAGRTVVCSLTVGYYENWRPDANQFSNSDIGANDVLDTASAHVRSLMVSRLNLAKTKGCDTVSLDGFESYQSASGFTLTSGSALEYARYLTAAARDRRLGVALHNAVDLAGQLADLFDFAIVRQCFERGQCASYQPFISKGKAVLAAEFTAFSQAQCSQAQAASISLAYFNEARDGSRYEPCP